MYLSWIVVRVTGMFNFKFLNLQMKDIVSQYKVLQDMVISFETTESLFAASLSSPWYAAESDVQFKLFQEHAD